MIRSTARVCNRLGVAFGLLLAATAVGQGLIRPLANDYVVVYESPDPENVYCYSPGLERLPSGRLVATFDLGGKGVAKLRKTLPAIPGGENRAAFGRVYTSDDHGRTWTHRVDFPFIHARPFAAGKSLYVLGHAGDLMILRSQDEGQTWGTASRLTEGQAWHQTAANVHRSGGNVYLVMERRAKTAVKSWAVAELAPVLMRGRMDTDLTQRTNWTLASELVFNDTVDYRKLDWFGVPFFSMDPRASTYPAPRRNMAPIGWLETNVVQFVDPNHVWYDPAGKTFHLWMRAHTGGTGLAAIAKVVEQADGSMRTMLETAPSGRKTVYVPCPGGQMRFHLLYDEPTRLYWLLSSQATDSMTRPDRLGDDRFNLPNNERHRLVLHFSKNCVDWCFAGVVAIGATPRQARHYASMIVDGKDLLVLSRSGDARAHSAHDGNLITLHRVSDFRRLVY